MIAIDANLLLYAYDESSPHHEPARQWLEEAFNGVPPVALPWPTVVAFLRIATNSRLLANPLSLEEAIEIVETWLARPNVFPVGPEERHWDLLKQQALSGQAAGPLMSDAHLAALALEHGCTLATHDRDFARFPALTTTDPIAPTVL